MNEHQTTETLSTLEKLVARVEELYQQNEQLQTQVSQLTGQLADLRALILSQARQEPTTTSDTWADSDSDKVSPFDTPPDKSAFCGQISDYEPGILFDDAAFDLTLRFDHGQGKQLARQWGFEDAGQLLSALLESCLIRLAHNSDVEELIFRRDIDSATVYAREREILEEALKRMLWAGASTASTMELIQQLSPESRGRE